MTVNIGEVGSQLDRVAKVIEIPYIELLDLSRDGRLAIALSNRTGSFQLEAIGVETRSILPLSHGKERVSWARVSHDSKTVAFSRDFGGKEAHQLFLVPARGGREKALTELPPTRIFDFNWSHGGDRIAFAGANQEYNGVWSVDTDSGKTSLLYQGPHWTSSPQWSQDDGVLCFSAKTTDAPTAAELLFLPEGGNHEPTVYTPKPGSENAGATWHPEEPTVLFQTDARGRYELAVYGMKKRRVRYLRGGRLGLANEFPVFGWMPDGQQVYYLASREGRTRLFLEDLNDGSPQEVPLPSGFHAGFFHSSLHVSASGSGVVFSWSSLSTPPGVARFDLQSKRTTTLDRHSTRLPLGKAEHVVYKSFDGRPIHGWFVKPPRQRGRRPCVLWIHGGPAWEVADEWNSAIQAFVVAGYPVFAPNIRGSTGYGVEFQNLNIHDVGGGDLRDVEYAAEYLRTRREVDPRRIAIVGASYGGYMTYLALGKLPDLWAAGAAIVGITDWREMYDLSDAAFRSFVERYFGKPEENPDLYRDRSPIEFVERVRAPLLIWHRGNDSRCPLAPVEKYATKLKQFGKTFEIEVVWDEGHGFQKTENVVRQYQGVVRFLGKYIGT